MLAHFIIHDTLLDLLVAEFHELTEVDGLAFRAFRDCPPKTAFQPTTPVPWEGPAYQTVLDTTNRDHQDKPAKPVVRR